MAKFLSTTGVSYHIEELIKGTKDRLILISPYLKFTDRVKEHLINLNVQKRDIRIIYRENKLHPDENNWLESQIGVRTSICKNLHAKCYINESEAIITSMNLYEFSQQNNNEMGILILKSQDPELYNDAFKEAQRLLTISEEIRVTVKKIPAEPQLKIERKKVEFKPVTTKKPDNQNGFCIRTGVPIPFDINNPLCQDALISWKRHKNPEYKEKFCHYSGEPSNGETSFNRPILKKNWQKAKEAFNLK